MDRRNLKVIILKEILEKKHILFGSFSPTLTKIDKNNAWKEIHQKAQALGLVPNSKDYTYTRDVFWQNMKKASVKKRDNSRRTGTGGGPSSKQNQVDEFIYEIIGRDTPALDGLIEPESAPEQNTSQVEMNEFENDAHVDAPPVDATAPRAPHMTLSNNATSQKKKIAKLKEQKLKLINKYLMLKIAKLEAERNTETDINDVMVEEYLQFSESDGD